MFIFYLIFYFFIEVIACFFSSMYTELFCVFELEKKKKMAAVKLDKKLISETCFNVL